jgi:hypothetical protein
VGIKLTLFPPDFLFLHPFKLKILNLSNMKKNLLLVFTFFFLISQVFSQSQFENASFEEWESIPYGSVPEPLEWSSIRTAEPDELAKVAPAVWNISDEAHSGEHSLYLTNISIFGIVATGTITTGRILANLNTDLANSHTDPDNPQWHCPLTKRPDSLVGWYKGNPSPNDFPTVKALLHTGYAALPQEDSSNWIGVAYIELSGSQVTEWTRFSVPFEYFNDNTPEFMLTILTAGDGLTPVDGSEAWFDDLELIYNGTSINELTTDHLHVYASNGILNVFLDETNKVQSTVSVVDLTGRQVYSGEIISGRNQQFALNLKNGVYIVTVQSGANLISKKVWVE